MPPAGSSRRYAFPVHAAAAVAGYSRRMSAPPTPEILHTTAGDLPLDEIELEIGGRAWRILHAGAVVSGAQERAFLRGEEAAKRPYGVLLWPAAIALAHEVASREVAGTRILELGAGTGLPGIIAASRGARVVQTDRQRLVLHVCTQNAARNGVTTIEHRLADWTAWDDPDGYDFILGSDILYAEALHPHLRHIFETNLARGGTVLLSDPFRAPSLPLLEQLEANGWRLALDKWTVGVAPPPRPVGIYALTRP